MQTQSLRIAELKAFVYRAFRYQDKYLSLQDLCLSKYGFAGIPGFGR
jgi:hypothetical protein